MVLLVIMFCKEVFVCMHVQENKPAETLNTAAKRKVARHKRLKAEIIRDTGWKRCGAISKDTIFGGLITSAVRKTGLLMFFVDR